MTKDEKRKALDSAIGNIEKSHGKGSIMRLGDATINPIEAVSTRSISLDMALGIGGLPKGRIIEIYAPESAGKTTLCLQVVAEEQSKGGVCAFIDTEHALDVGYAGKLGVDVPNLYLSQPEYGEQALEIVESLIRSEAMGVVVVDSVASLVPRAELEGEMGDSVTFDTPVLIRNKKTKQVDIVSISSLYKGGKTFQGKRYVNRYSKVKNIEVFTHEGWAQLKTVFFKLNKNKKKIVLTNTTCGAVSTTQDHSLFVSGKAVSPKELMVGNSIDIAKIKRDKGKKFDIDDSIAWLLGFFCAEGHQRTANSFNVCNTEVALIEKFKTILSEYFYISHCSTVRKYKDGIRKPLHIFSFHSNDYISWMLQDCIDSTKFKKVPKCILNGKPSTQKAFLEGFKDGDGNSNVSGYDLYSSSQILMSGLVFLYNNLGFKYSLHARKRKNLVEYSLQQSIENAKKVNQINRFVECNAPKYLYDIETETGTFVGGIGNILLHNSHMGLQARLMSQALRKLTAIVAKTNTTLIFTNQLRDKIGVMFGSPETTTGGKALKFYASVRIDMRKREAIKDGTNIIGNKTHIKIVKNKVAPPFKECDVEIIYNEGISRVSDLIEVAVGMELIKKGGAWFTYGDQRFQGRDNLAVMLKERPDIFAKLDREVRELAGLPVPEIKKEKK